MSAFTLAEATAILAEVRSAYTEALKSQELTVPGRGVVRPDLGALLSQIKYWSAQVNRLSNGGIKLTGAST